MHNRYFKVYKTFKIDETPLQNAINSKVFKKTLKRRKFKV